MSDHFDPAQCNNIGDKLLNEWLWAGGDVWQQRSYARFVDEVLPHLICSCNLSVDIPERRIRHRVWITDVSVRSPTVKEKDGRVRPLLPHEARLRRLSYNLQIIVKIRHTMLRYRDCRMRACDLLPPTGTDTTEGKAKIMELPCMVGSRWCHLKKAMHAKEQIVEDGGIFISEGSEKLVLGQCVGLQCARNVLASDPFHTGCVWP